MSAVGKCKCKDGYLWVAYDRNEKGWELYRFSCKCTFANGAEWPRLLESHFYKRSPDEVRTHLPSYAFVHPRLNDLMWAGIKERVAIKLDNPF